VNLIYNKNYYISTPLFAPLFIDFSFDIDLLFAIFWWAVWSAFENTLLGDWVTWTYSSTIIDNTFVYAETKRDSLKYTLLLAEKKRDLLNKIKANGVFLDKDNNSDSFIVSAKWLKKDW